MRLVYGTAANGEGIYGSRPWKIYGEKPVDKPVKKLGRFDRIMDIVLKTFGLQLKVTFFMPGVFGKP